ncbi:MAG: hypothetical protein AB7E52_02585 [Bdellovibrionales bacterium]
MTESYVNVKIREALKVTNGDRKDAAKLLTTWAVRDQALLLGFTKAELKDIIEAKLEKTSKGSKKEKETLGDAIVFGGGKGDKRSSSHVPPPKSSERQASVMHQLAAAFKKKK